MSFWNSQNISPWPIRLVLGLYGLLILLTFQDYGITSDEPSHVRYGTDILLWYTSFFQDRSVFQSRNTWLYGGSFDATTALLAHLLPFNRFDAQHLCTALTGLLGVMAAYRLGKLLGNQQTGILAALFLILTPRYYGHAFNNPKDLPFAVCYLWTIYYAICTLKQLPKPPRTLLWKTGLALGLALGIRIGGVLLIFFFGLFGLFFHLTSNPREALFRNLLQFSKQIGTILLVAWPTMLLFWPWGQVWPLMGVWEAVLTFSAFPENHQSFFQGHYIDSNEIPRYYAPLWFLLTLPEFLLTGLATGIYWLWNPSLWDKNRALETGLLIAAACFPIAYTVLFQMPLYDGIRHLLFVIPPLAILAALGTGRLLALSGHAPPILGLILSGLIFLTAYDMIALHPNQYIYFNRVFGGGVQKASETFETDYWHNSYKQALTWLDQQPRPQNQPLRLASSYPPLAIYIENSAAYTYEALSEAADIYLGTTRFDQHRIIPGEVVHIVSAQGANLLYLIRPDSTFQNNPFFSESPYRHIYIGDQAEESGDTQHALIAFQRAIEINPKDYRTLNHIGELYHSQQQDAEAIDYFRQSIAQKPNFHWAHQNLGVVLYQTQHYPEAIDAFHKALAFKPDFAPAHFSLANAFYRQNKNEQAIAAYQNALRFRPGYRPALRNLAQVYFFSNQAEAALKIYKEIIHQMPEDVEAHIGKGYVLKTINKPDEALAAFRTAVRLGPDEIKAWEGLSNLLAEQGKIDEAIQAYRQILILEPDHTVAKEKLKTLRLSQ
ncbi:MAG: tetratricopeptide repeat protein [bacterium]|nr:tetratricopeptide repeat protein [bacterium]